MKPLILMIVLMHPFPSLGKVLSLSEYVKVIESQDVEAKRYIHQRMQIRFQKELEMTDSSWFLTLSNTHGIAVSQQPTTRRTDLTLSKNFRDTGTNLDISYGKNTLADRQEEVQSIQLQQSLLQNFMGRRSQLREKGLEQQAQVTYWQTVETYEDYIAEKLGQYLDFVSAWKNFQTAQQQLKEVNSIWNEVQQRRKSNIALEVDLHRSEVEKIQYERNLLEAQQELKRLQSLLTATFEDKNIEISPDTKVPWVDDSISFSTEKKVFLDTGRTISIHKARLQASEYLKESTERQDYPEAQLVLGYNQDQSQRFSTLINREDKVIGFNISYRFDSTLREAEIAQARYRNKQAELQNLSDRMSITSLMENLENQIELQKQRVSLLKRQQKAAKLLVTGENKRFQKGRIDLETLITAQNNYHQTRYELTAQEVLLAKHILNWKVLLDQLVPTQT